MLISDNRFINHLTRIATELTPEATEEETDHLVVNSELFVSGMIQHYDGNHDQTESADPQTETETPQDQGLEYTTNQDREDQIAHLAIRYNLDPNHLSDQQRQIIIAALDNQ